MYFKGWHYNHYISESLDGSVILVMQENNHLIYISVTLSYFLCYYVTLHHVLSHPRDYSHTAPACTDKLPRSSATCVNLTAPTFCSLSDTVNEKTMIVDAVDLGLIKVPLWVPSWPFMADRLPGKHTSRP